MFHLVHTLNAFYDCHFFICIAFEWSLHTLISWNHIQCCHISKDRLYNVFFCSLGLNVKLTINVSQWTRLNHVPWAANSINDNNFLECFSTRRPQKRVASKKIQLTIFISISIRSSMCINIAQGVIVFIDRAKKNCHLAVYL